MDHRQVLLALHLTGVVGPRRLRSLKESFENLEDVFGVSEEKLLSLQDWIPSAAKKLLSLKNPEERVERELKEADENQVDVVVEGEDDFPKTYENLYDPPFVLWRKGRYQPEDVNAVGVVGCRKPSPYGRHAALHLSEGIARAGYTVVSGLARGIDSFSHIGALRYPRGRTIAFLGSGLLNLYPPENDKLASEIIERGALFSEYPLRSKPLALHFPQRNRLISGASRGVVVVEAKKDSGTFITVDHAIDQGRPVFAVPGPIDHPQSEGTHSLIQQGAKLVTCVEDILHEFQDRKAEALYRSRKTSETPQASLNDLAGDEKLVLEKISHNPTHVDSLARESQLPLRKLNELLLMLEMKGFIQQTPGHCYFRI